MSGSVIHSGQVVIDLTLSIPALPAPGGDVFAQRAGMSVGGGYNVLYAARRFDVPTLYAGMLGTGPFAEAARRELKEIGVTHVGRTSDIDQGYCVALTDATAERTFISTCGAETQEKPDAFDHLAFGPEDVLYISGYSFVTQENQTALLALAERIVKEKIAVRAVFDVSPMVEYASIDVLEAIGAITPLWSVNEREAAILAGRFELEEITEEKRPDYANLVELLAQRFGEVLVRAGAQGAWYSDGGSARFIPTIEVDPVDTNGAGDAHAGTLCALLARGEDVEVALRWANVAGALSTTIPGPATCPTPECIAARV